MPGIFHQPQDRRSFLKIVALSGAASVMTGCQSMRYANSSVGEFHVALLSDTHIPGDRKNGHRGFNPWENLQRIVPEVSGVKPHAVILNGDAARLEGRVEDYQELKSLLAPIASVSPIVIGMGNHDDRKPFAQVFANGPAETKPLPDREVAVIESATVRLVVLDSLLYVNKVAGLLGRKQREWLARDLAVHRDRPTALLVHHTLEDGDGDLLDASRLFELIRPHRHVKAIFFGHSHVWNLSERQGVKLINLPAVGYNFADKDPVGWVDARFHRRGVDLVLHAFAGNQEADGREFPVRWS